MAITLEQVKSKSARRLQGLLPVVRKATERLIERSFSLGILIVITQGLRTIAEQNALYAQGRTKPGQKVTNAKGGYSYHNFGVAVDFALLLPDGMSVSWDTVRDGNGDRKADWMQVAEIGKALGFEWGGDWTSFKDMPHFQMTFGLTTAQYRADRRPTEPQIQVMFKRLGIREEKPVTNERDINKVSNWAVKDWTEAQENGYFDGNRPGATITREETAIVVNKLRRNFLALIDGVKVNVKDLEESLKGIEAEG
ncbi:M15 family metallopeptidase [Paenibacillus polymyxa]|uniref:M15 family metallopeptidase n=1 Tax=Paenibacillus polymyxa TaxID=1406 RepID=UPI0009BE64B3